MPWPTDPEAQARARANIRKAQQRRRAQETSEAREVLRQKGRAQFAAPEARKQASEIRKAQLAQDPQALERLRAFAARGRRKALIMKLAAQRRPK